MKSNLSLTLTSSLSLRIFENNLNILTETIDLTSQDTKCVSIPAASIAKKQTRTRENPLKSNLSTSSSKTSTRCKNSYYTRNIQKRSFVCTSQNFSSPQKSFKKSSKQTKAKVTYTNDLSDFENNIYGGNASSSSVLNQLRKET